MHSVTSNAVSNAIGLLQEETVSGTYFGGVRYSKTFLIPNITLTANVGTVIMNNFEIAVNRAVGFECFIVNSQACCDCGGLYIQKDIYGNNQLCIISQHNGVLFVVARVYYIKD